MIFSIKHRITYVWSEVGDKHRIYETGNLGHRVGYSKYRTSKRTCYIGMWKIESTADRNLMNSHWCCKHYNVSGNVVWSQKIQAVQAQAWGNKTWSIELYNENKPILWVFWLFGIYEWLGVCFLISLPIVLNIFLKLVKDVNSYDLSRSNSFPDAANRSIPM